MARPCFPRIVGGPHDNKLVADVVGDAFTRHRVALYPAASETDRYANGRLELRPFTIGGHVFDVVVDPDALPSPAVIVAAILEAAGIRYIDAAFTA